ncbi:MAG: HAD family hydrolase [Actinomycetes bacterium]
MTSPRRTAVTAVVFDLGGVLIDWDPRHLYRRLLASEEEIETFLDEVDFAGWNHAMDAGRGTWAEAVQELGARHPHRRELIAAYPARFAETLSGALDDSVEVLRDLAEQGTRLFALTNWSAETFETARHRFGFLDLFDDIVVSGEEGVAKPDPAIFAVLVDRHRLDPAGTVFVDDAPANVDAATAAGLTGLLFTDAQGLRRDLSRLGLLAGAGSG